MKNDNSIHVEIDREEGDATVCYENSGFVIPIGDAVQLRDRLRSCLHNASGSESGSAADKVYVMQLNEESLTVGLGELWHGWCDLTKDDAKDLLSCLEEELATRPSTKPSIDRKSK